MKNREQKEIPTSKEPFTLLERILVMFKRKIKPVELQHAAKKMWVK